MPTQPTTNNLDEKEYKYHTAKEILKDKWFWIICGGWLIISYLANYVNGLIFNNSVCK